MIGSNCLQISTLPLQLLVIYLAYQKQVLATETFSHAISELAAHIYNDHVGAWDGFHGYVSSKLKNFKHRFSISNMDPYQMVFESSSWSIR